MTRFAAPLRLRSSLGERAHKVSWAELFFDLIFVAAIAQVAEPLRHHYAIAELGRLAPLLLLIWWAWTGHTFFATRIDTDGASQRLLTFLQMFIVAAMAANATDALDSRSTAGFVAAYAVMRLVLVSQYIRARRLPEVRTLAAPHIGGHSAAAALWLVSSILPPPWRFWLWAAALVVDLGTPWVAVRHAISVPPQPAHLPERFGLFTLILLGDAVVAVMKGMESQHEWVPEAAVSAVLGLGMICATWWWYFGEAGGAEQHVRSRRDAVRVYVWSYAHFPLYVGIIVVGVGLQRIVTMASHAELGRGEVMLLTAGVTLTMLAVTALTAARGGSREGARRRVLKQVLLSGATATAGFVATPTLPIALVVALALLMSAQLAVSLERHDRRDAPRPQAVTAT